MDYLSKKIEDIEIRINRGVCISAATCVVYAPNTFNIDDKGLAIIKEKDWDRVEKIVAAAQSCPALAIEVYQGGKRMYPV
ncbi:ferredoxin [candidate division WWE3 bacterium CG08_land_8_20_14_0_20_40_13]|uniref:Ferredoxin n=1 Tax=candidate division WWE3 bacterium CG08_land_8_20_14_0_20_40_13 TaxID=1975084 RepID=A0A2H0XDF2_UNCKA|nr:MAG: ferredoxin [candidate division WWE3 bacterium CG08_land_8_20_14_0_20_40_13]